MLDKPKHILHIGANWGQETSEYIDSFKDGDAIFKLSKN